MSNEDGRTGGLGLASVLTIVFVVLKLTGNIDWSWWWVLCPSLIDIGLFVLLLFGVLVADAVEKQEQEEGPWTWPGDKKR